MYIKSKLPKERKEWSYLSDYEHLLTVLDSIIDDIKKDCSIGLSYDIIQSFKIFKNEIKRLEGKNKQIMEVEHYEVLNSIYIKYIEYISKNGKPPKEVLLGKYQHMELSKISCCDYITKNINAVSIDTDDINKKVLGLEVIRVLKDNYLKVV